MPSRLLLREWAALFVVGGALLVLALTSWLSEREISQKAFFSSPKTPKQPPPPIEIVVEGAVERPGVYLFGPGVTVKEVLASAGLKKEALRRSLNLKKVLHSSQTISVPSKAKKKSVRTKTLE